MAQDTMTPAEAAAYLRLSPESVKRKALRGEVPAAKTGRKWLFRRADLDAWLAAGGTVAHDRPDALDRALLSEAERRMADPAEEFVPYSRARRELGL